MNQNSNTLLFILKTLYSPLINSYIILFYLLTTTTSSSSDPKFDACQPKTCGNNQNISYPFYIQGLQEPFCGYPGFGISCAPNGFPILYLSNTQYIIHEIFYENQSLQVSNAVFSNSISNATTKGCLPRAQNLTLPNYFSLAPNQKDVILFFGCDSQSLPSELQEHSIGCYAENETSSVIAIYKEDKNISFVSNNCKGVSVVVDSMVEDGKGGIEEALRKGLLLKWTASNCSECSSTGGRCGFDSDMYSFRCYCTDRVHSAMCDQAPPHKIGKTPKVLIITAASVAGVAALVFLACFAYLLFWRKKNQTHRIMEEFLKEHGPLPTTRYSYSEVKKMTNSFRNKLGQGGYGCVYEGKLHDGQIVAVKVLSESKGDGGDFINEVASISKTSHVNVVRLLGFCLDGSKRALIYEFMPNGSLEKFTFDDATNPSRDDHQLNCKTLYDIAIGIARGLEYLHRGCNTRILHFDIKPHNILLDVDFCPKISDFGLAKICPRKESVVSIFGARGTIGYMAPELFSRNFGGVSHKSDVYSYGMVVLEMVGQRKNIKIEVDRYSEIYFPHWIYKQVELNQQLQLQCIKNENDEEIVRKMIVVSLLCIQIDPSNRPTMSRVLEMLEGSLEALQIPPKSFLSFPSAS